MACGRSPDDDVSSSVQQCELDDTDVCSNLPFATTTASPDEANPMPIDAGIRYYIDGPGAGQRGYVVFTPTHSGTHTLYFGDAEPARVCDEEALCASAVTSCGDLHRAAQYALVEGEPYVIELKPIAPGDAFVLKIVGPDVPPPPPPPPPGGLKLAPPVFYSSTGSWSRDMSVGDIDGDGAVDVVLSNPDDAGGELYVDILANNGSGAFAHAARVNTSAPAETVIADFDGDGDRDIAGIATDGQGPLPNFLLHNTGNFMFTKSTWTPTLQYRGTLSGGDFDEDGITDVVATYMPDDTSTASGFVIHAMPSAAVLDQEAVFGPSTGTAIAGDFNGDGHQDVIAGSRAAPRVRLYLGDGTGSVAYDRELTLPVSQHITKLIAVNLDGNNVTDFLAFGAGPEGYGIESAAVTTSSASGFETQALSGASYGAAAGDFDHDGRIDLITGVPDASDSPYLSFYRGTPDGFVFAGHLPFGTYSGSAQMTSVDVNNDGFADLIVGRVDGIQVFLGTP